MSELEHFLSCSLFLPINHFFCITSKFCASFCSNLSEYMVKLLSSKVFNICQQGIWFMSPLYALRSIWKINTMFSSCSTATLCLNQQEGLCNIKFQLYSIVPCNVLLPNLTWRILAAQQLLCPASCWIYLLNMQTNIQQLQLFNINNSLCRTELVTHLGVKPWLADRTLQCFISNHLDSTLIHGPLLCLLGYRFKNK